MVRSDLQVQNVPGYLQIMDIHYLSEKSLEIREHLKKNHENNRIPNDFDYLMVEVRITQGPTNRFSQQINFFLLGLDPFHMVSDF